METKNCEICGAGFSRPADYSRVQWVSRKFCSKECSEEKKRQTRKTKHRCKSCGGSGPFHSYTTRSGRTSQRSKCKECWNETRKPKRNTPEQRKKETQYSKNFRNRVRLTEPHRIVCSKAWAIKNPEKHLFFRMKANSIKKKGRIERRISFDDFLREIGGKMPERCPILGIKLSLDAPPKSDCIPTIDRINSSKNYEAGNIAVISWRANVIKNMGTAEDHRRIAEWMDHQNSVRVIPDPDAS